MLYRTVQQRLETWLAHCREGHDDEGPVPGYVEREFRRYLECGILAHDFARARCEARAIELSIRSKPAGRAA